MTLQMALLEERMKSEEQKAESIAIKLIRRGRPFNEIHEDTDLPVQRLEELAKGHLKKQRSNHVER